MMRRIRRTSARAMSLAVLAMVAVVAQGGVSAAYAQGLVRGAQQGARQGNRAAGPIGGVLGGAVGGVVGAVGGVLGVGSNGRSVRGPVSGRSARQARAKAKAAAQAAEPQTAEQIVAASDANIARIKDALKLTPEQEKNWAGFSNAMHALGNNGAQRLTLRETRARRDPPDDIIEQMRNEAQFLNDRAVDQRAVADAAEPLFTSLDDKQKALFVGEMVQLSRERGLD